MQIKFKFLESISMTQIWCTKILSFKPIGFGGVLTDNMQDLILTARNVLFDFPKFPLVSIFANSAVRALSIDTLKSPLIFNLDWRKKTVDNKTAYLEKK